MRRKLGREATVVRVANRSKPTRAELAKVLRGLCAVAVDVLRESGDVEAVDSGWIEANVRFPEAGTSRNASQRKR
jgi:hypothetical protein